MYLCPGTRPISRCRAFLDIFLAAEKHESSSDPLHFPSNNLLASTGMNMFGLKPIAILLLAGLSIGAASTALDPAAPVVVGQTFLANSVDPTEGSTPWALTSHGVAEKLFTVDQNGEIVGQIAQGLEKVNDSTWDVWIKPGCKFSNGLAVTPELVASALTELNAINPSAQSSLGEMTVTPQGGLKVRIESERPTHVMDAVLAEWVFVIYSKDSGGNFVYTGPYAIEHFANDHIDLKPNRFYNDDDILQRPQITIQKFADGHDLAMGVESNEIDIAFHLPIDTLPELRKAEDVRVKSFEVGYHYMMLHNVDKQQDVRVRKAIDLAIDRTALSQALAGGTATRSLFPDYTPYFSDVSNPHGDSTASANLLDEAGWVLNSAGRREKDGTELAMNLVAYPHRPGLVIMQPLIEEALVDLGITVNSILTGMDWSETQAIIDEKSFDLLLWAQHTLPAGDPLWFLSAFFRSDGGNNHSGLESTTVDAMLDELSLAEDHDDRVETTASVQHAILEEVPVSNLVTPFWHVGLSERMADYEPWGSDYYVIRADLFLSEPTSEGGTTEAPSSSTKPKDIQGMLAVLAISVLSIVLVV